VWFVDVLVWRTGKSAGAQVYLKTGKMASVKVLGDVVKDRKANKTWTKRFMNWDFCDAVSFVGEDKVEVSMEIVARIQRPCAGVEAKESLKAFDKQWIVPIVGSF
jgi:hypothetical protein